MQGKECFIKSNVLSGVDYVFHTAAPFMSSPSLRENDEAIRKYIEATQVLVEASVANRIKKVVFTGSASSVIGQFPVKDPNFVYTDPYNWVDAKAINKPNEKAKILAEKVCWNAIKK
jgi:nucleoside-diphosphate-sugar epimerase